MYLSNTWSMRCIGLSVLTTLASAAYISDSLVPKSMRGFQPAGVVFGFFGLYQYRPCSRYTLRGRCESFFLFLPIGPLYSVLANCDKSTVQRRACCWTPLDRVRRSYSC